MNKWSLVVFAACLRAMLHILCIEADDKQRWDMVEPSPTSVYLLLYYRDSSVCLDCDL